MMAFVFHTASTPSVQMTQNTAYATRPMESTRGGGSATGANSREAFSAQRSVLTVRPALLPGAKPPQTMLQLLRGWPFAALALFTLAVALPDYLRPTRAPEEAAAAEEGGGGGAQRAAWEACVLPEALYALLRQAFDVAQLRLVPQVRDVLPRRFVESRFVSSRKEIVVFQCALEEAHGKRERVCGAGVGSRTTRG